MRENILSVSIHMDMTLPQFAHVIGKLPVLQEQETSPIVPLSEEQFYKRPLFRRSDKADAIETSART